MTQLLERHPRALRFAASLAGMLAIVAALAGSRHDAAAAARAHTHVHSHAHPSKTLTAKQVAFRDAMRKLWEDHITWTRLAIVDIAAGAPSTNATVGRLLQNQVDIGNAIKPYYGKAAGNKLTALLKQHILIAADVLTAAKTANQTGLASAQERWNANANQIAAFLHGANPKQWSLPMLRTMMRTHLDLTTREAVAWLNGDWSGSINAYESVHAEILAMSDMLSTGIERQFRARFR